MKTGIPRGTRRLSINLRRHARSVDVWQSRCERFSHGSSCRQGRLTEPDGHRRREAPRTYAGTYNAHPVTVAATLACLQKLSDPKLQIYETLDRRTRKLLAASKEPLKAWVTAVVSRQGSAHSYYFMNEAPTNWWQPSPITIPARRAAAEGAHRARNLLLPNPHKARQRQLRAQWRRYRPHNRSVRGCS